MLTQHLHALVSIEEKMELKSVILSTITVLHTHGLVGVVITTLLNSIRMLCAVNVEVVGKLNQS